MSLLTSCMLSKLVSSCCSKSDLIVNTIGVYLNLKLSLICLTHIKIGYFCLLSSIILKSFSLRKAKSKLIIPRIGASRLCRILSKDGFSLFHLGGCGQIMGGVICSLITGLLGGASHRLTRVNFFLTLGCTLGATLLTQFKRSIIASTIHNIIRLSKCVASTIL